MLLRLINLVASLRLTVVCLCLGAMLVFFGTLAQVDWGLYQVQDRFFHSTLVYWSPPGADWKLPVFPGGYLLGAALLLNLFAALIQRFTVTKTKIGLTTHAGIIVLIAGQWFADLFQVESQMRLTQGKPLNYSEAERMWELVIIDATNPAADGVVAFSESKLATGVELRHDKLPFTIRLKRFLPNARLERRSLADKDEPLATQGVGRDLNLRAVPRATKTQECDVPSAIIEIANHQGLLGAWLVSGLLETNETLNLAGKTFQVGLRRVRYYLPFSLELQNFTHEVYNGTEIPRHFTSRVRLRHSTTGEDRETQISMNKPLRYGGATFYQSGYEEQETHVSILQVVRNPGGFAPYLACGLIIVGLVVQFTSHLIGFATKRRTV